MKTFIKVAFLSICLMFFFEADASHFRYGTISYVVQSETGSGLTKQTVVKFTFHQAYRGNYFGAFPSVGNVVATESFNFGDGSFSVTINLTVTATDALENWFLGTGSLTHTYTGNVDVTAYLATCCRIGSLSGSNANDNFRTEAVVTLSKSSNDSPVSGLPPIVNVPDGQASYTFSLNASDPNSNAMTFALSTVAQSSLNPNNPVIFTSINASTGLVTLNTSSAGVLVNQLWALQFMITDSRGATTPIDFIVKIVGSSQPPAFDYPPTPADNSTIAATVGSPVNFSVKATDPDVADVVGLNGSGIPAGANFTPGTPANPVTTAFSWTPAIGDIGIHVISFTATDNNGVQKITTVTINVTSSCPSINKTIKPYGKHKFWVNQGASDPNTFYFGLSQWKRLRAIVSGGGGPYTYAWSSNTGTMKNQWGNQVYLFEPTMAPIITCTITDQSNGCVYIETINLGWDTQYYCGNLAATGKDYWMITVCKGGVTMCVNHTIGKGWLKSGAATLGACGSSKTNNLVSTKGKESFILYPNPSNGLFTVDYQLDKDASVSVFVSDIIGNVVLRKSMKVSSGVYSDVIDMTNFETGMYILVINIDGKTFSKRIQLMK